MPTRSTKVLVTDVSVTFGGRGQPIAALDRISLEVAAGTLTLWFHQRQGLTRFVSLDAPQN
jgi:hypothetical protein